MVWIKCGYGVWNLLLEFQGWEFFHFLASLSLCHSFFINPYSLTYCIKPTDIIIIAQSSYYIKDIDIVFLIIQWEEVCVGNTFLKKIIVDVVDCLNFNQEMIKYFQVWPIITNRLIADFC